MLLFLVRIFLLIAFALWCQSVPFLNRSSCLWSISTSSFLAVDDNCSLILSIKLFILSSSSLIWCVFFLSSRTSLNDDSR